MTYLRDVGLLRRDDATEINVEINRVQTYGLDKSQWCALINLVTKKD